MLAGGLPAYSRGENRFVYFLYHIIFSICFYGQGPEKILISLGYAGWSAGQLEEEIAQNAWLTVRAPSAQVQDSVIFDMPSTERFDAAMHLLGIDPMQLSKEVGHA